MACSAEGAIDIQLLWPEKHLEPDRDEVFEITLVRNATGEPSTRTVHRVLDPSGEVALGRVEAGADLRLAVELRSPNQRLIGYGRSLAEQDVAAGDTLTVEMNMRKPFLYMTGDAAISVFDPTVDSTAIGTIDGLDNPRATAVSSDGSLLFVAHGPPGSVQLTVLATANHALSTEHEVIDLGTAPDDLAVSADGRYVIMGHSLGLSVADMTRAGDELGAVSEVDVGGPVSRVSVAPGIEPIAYALIERNTACSGTPSRVEARDLREPQTSLGTLTLSSPAQDIAALPATGADRTVLIASGCDNEILTANMAASEDPAFFASVTGVSALAVLDDRIWAAGSTTTTAGAHLLAVSLNSDGDVQSSAEMPVLQERVETEEFSGETDEAVRQMAAESVTAVHMAVLPGGETLAMTIDSYYYAPPRGAFVEIPPFEIPILPELEVRNQEFLLVDATNSALVRRVRTDCALNLISPDALVYDWECGQSPDQERAQVRFVPTGLSSLYGAK